MISRQTPQATTLAEYGYAVTAFPGVYHSHYPLLNKIDLLVLNELSDEPYNVFIKLFASRQQVRARSFGLLMRMSWRAWSEQLWNIIFTLRTLWGIKGDEMSEVLTLERILEIGEQVRKQVMAGISPEKQLSELSPAELQRLLTKNEQIRKQAIANAPPEDRLAGLAPEDRLVGLSPEECKALIAQIEAYLQQQAGTPTQPVKPAKKP